MIGSVTFLFFHYNNAKSTINGEMNESVSSIDHSVGEKKVSNENPLSIVLMGVDETDSDQGRSDALMVLTLDPSDNRSQLVSIPRDTRTELIGEGSNAGNYDKINHAYAFGGTDMAVQTVENFLDHEMDYYIRMNIEGLSEMVDAIGGVTVKNDLEWKGKSGFHYNKGEISLDGPQTMGFVRMRSQDPNGDFGRTERQRKVIKAIIEKGSSVASVNKIGAIMDVLGNNMKTNLDFNTMQSLLLNYRSAQKNIDTYQVKGSGVKIDGIYYLEVNEKEVNKVQQMIDEYH